MQGVRFILCAAIVSQAVLGVLSTANNNADDKTKRIYSALTRLGGKVLSGQFGGWTNCGDFNGFGLGQANDIQRATSKSPAVYGLDCATGWSTTAPGQEANVIECFNKDFAAYGSKGGLLTISHHLPNPVFAGNNANGEGAYKTSISNNDYATILQNGSPARKRWLAMLDKIAGGLLAYKSRGMTVLYRPFHEMNGDWFWWGASKNEAENGQRMALFKKLWIDVFNFMKNKGVNNLLWVYSPDNSRQLKTGFYPGGNYVDLVGLDFYSDNPSDLDGYNDLVGLGKPFCLGEVGPKNTNGQYDYGNFINTVLSRYPKTVYIMPWNAGFNPANNKGASALYNNPRVINLGQFRY